MSSWPRSGAPTSERWTSATSRRCIGACPGIGCERNALPVVSNDGTPRCSPGAQLGPVGVRGRLRRGSWTRCLASPSPAPTRSGPVFAAYGRFLSPHSRVRTLASHGYGLNNCVTNPASAAYPSIPHLLSDYALHDLLNTLIPYVGLAHADGATFRIDEMGSVTCNGRPGVSNTMASALWAAAALFSVAQDGVDGVNLHTYPGLSNGLFDFTDTARGWTGAVHPLYYGALLFARAAPAGSRLLHMSLSGPPTLHGWATAGPGSVRHVLLLNDSLTDSAAVVVSAPHGALGTRAAQLERLTAPSASATGDLVLGGRTFGGVTATGRLRPPVRDPLPNRGGVYRVTLPAASAAVLTFTTR